MTDKEWEQMVLELSTHWLRRGVVTPEGVDEILEHGISYWSADRIDKIADDIRRDTFGLHERPLWYRRWRNKWGERVT